MHLWTIVLHGVQNLMPKRSKPTETNLAFLVTQVLLIFFLHYNSALTSTSAAMPCFTKICYILFQFPHFHIHFYMTKRSSSLDNTNSPVSKSPLTNSLLARSKLLKFHLTKYYYSCSTAHVQRSPHFTTLCECPTLAKECHTNGHHFKHPVSIGQTLGMGWTE